MSIIVEDGTGVESANSYVDVAFADEYFTARGNQSWTDASVSAKEQALINATDYIDLRWGSKLGGRPETSVQALLFPRTGMYDNLKQYVEGIPSNWKRAVCEYAVEALNGDLNRQADRGTDSSVARKRVTIGPITTETSTHPGTATQSSIAYPKADGYAKQYVRIHGAVIRA